MNLEDFDMFATVAEAAVRNGDRDERAPIKALRLAIATIDELHNKAACPPGCTVFDSLRAIESALMRTGGLEWIDAAVALCGQR